MFHETSPPSLSGYSDPTLPAPEGPPVGGFAAQTSRFANRALFDSRKACRALTLLCFPAIVGENARLLRALSSGDPYELSPSCRCDNF
jgi:hypothetical protein